MGPRDHTDLKIHVNLTHPHPSYLILSLRHFAAWATKHGLFIYKNINFIVCFYLRYQRNGNIVDEITLSHIFVPHNEKKKKSRFPFFLYQWK